MNKEIKFRAWDKERKEFLSAGNIFISIGTSRNPLSNIYLDTISNPDLYKDRFILMQFTGLLDKNGIPVYKGDIVKITGNDYYSNNNMTIDKEDTWEYIGKVFSDNFMWVASNIPFCDLDYNELEIEVIGNIYENPKLV